MAVGQRMVEARDVARYRRPRRAGDLVHEAHWNAAALHARRGRGGRWRQCPAAPDIVGPRTAERRRAQSPRHAGPPGRAAAGVTSRQVEHRKPIAVDDRNAMNRLGDVNGVAEVFGALDAIAAGVLDHGEREGVAVRLQPPAERPDGLGACGERSKQCEAGCQQSTSDRLHPGNPPVGAILPRTGAALKAGSR